MSHNFLHVRCSAALAERLWPPADRQYAHLRSDRVMVVFPGSEMPFGVDLDPGLFERTDGGARG
jgi:hypothetical protein